MSIVINPIDLEALESQIGGDENSWGAKEQVRDKVTQDKINEIIEAVNDSSNFGKLAQDLKDGIDLKQNITDNTLNTTNKTVVGAINETIVTDSAVNGNIKIAGVESTVYTHPNHSGDIVSTGDGDTVISENAVSNSKLAQMPTMTVKGNDAVGSADPQDLTVPEVRTMIQDSTHRMVTDAQIVQWNSASSVIKYYGTQTLAIADEANISLGNYIETMGGVSINDGLGGEYVVEGTLTDTTGGWKIGTGKYANRRIKNSKSYNAELVGTPTASTPSTGDDSTKIATTEFVNDMVGGTGAPAISKAANGYVKMANGLILQWGDINLGSKRQVTVTFPITFPNECLNVQGSSRNNVYYSTYEIMVYSITPTQVVLVLDASGGDVGAYWFAIGY